MDDLDLKSLIDIFELDKWLSMSWKLWKELLSIELLSAAVRNDGVVGGRSWWWKLPMPPASLLWLNPWVDFSFGGSICLLIFVPFDGWCCCFKREFCFAVIFALSSAATDFELDFVVLSTSEWMSWFGEDFEPFVLCSLASAFVIFSCFFPICVCVCVQRGWEREKCGKCNKGGFENYVWRFIFQYYQH